MNNVKRREILTRLRDNNPHPTTELNFSSPFELLIAVLLSAQATDVSVNKATAKLYPVANTPQAMLELGVEGVKASFAVVPIGDEVHVSARSTGKINVQLLLEKLNGGGHFDSAGTRLGGTDTEKAVALLKEAIDTYLDEKNIRAGE